MNIPINEIWNKENRSIYLKYGYTKPHTRYFIMVCRYKCVVCGISKSPIDFYSNKGDKAMCLNCIKKLAKSEKVNPNEFIDNYIFSE